MVFTTFTNGTVADANEVNTNMAYDNVTIEHNGTHYKVKDGGINATQLGYTTKLLSKDNAASSLNTVVTGYTVVKSMVLTGGSYPRVIRIYGSVTTNSQTGGGLKYVYLRLFGSSGPIVSGSIGAPGIVDCTVYFTKDSGSQEVLITSKGQNGTGAATTTYTQTTKNPASDLTIEIVKYSDGTSGTFSVTTEILEVYGG